MLDAYLEPEYEDMSFQDSFESEEAYLTWCEEQADYLAECALLDLE